MNRTVKESIKVIVHSLMIALIILVMVIVNIHEPDAETQILNGCCASVFTILAYYILEFVIKPTYIDYEALRRSRDDFRTKYLECQKELDKYRSAEVKIRCFKEIVDWVDVHREDGGTISIFELLINDYENESNKLAK